MKRRESSTRFSEARRQRSRSRPMRNSVPRKSRASASSTTDRSGIPSGRRCARRFLNSQVNGSSRTVDSHVAAVLEKLGTRTRKEAVARATDLGILNPGR